MTVGTGLRLSEWVSSGTHLQRLAFTPNPATPASGPNPSAFWFETDTGLAYAWNFATPGWAPVSSSLPNAVGNNKLLGSNGSGAGAPYSELTLGTGLSITGSTLNAAAAGGGSNYKGFGEPKLSTGNTFAAGNWGGRSAIMDEACTLNSVLFGSTAAVATAHVQAAIYSDVSNIPTTLLASSSVILGVTAGLNILTLTSPLTVSQGEPLWIGVLVTTTAVPTWNGSGVGTAFFGSAGPAPATAGACSFVNALEINFWGSK